MNLGSVENEANNEGQKLVKEGRLSKTCSTMKVVIMSNAALKLRYSKLTVWRTCRQPSDKL